MEQNSAVVERMYIRVRNMHVQLLAVLSRKKQRLEVRLPGFEFSLLHLASL